MTLSCTTERKREIEILNLGLRSYSEVWELQKKFQRALIDKSGHDVLILCEHPPVVTLGRSANPANVLARPDQLAKSGVELYKVERGGDVTYHGPGQLVGYPIMDLNYHKRDVAWFLRNIEQVIIDTLSEYGLETSRIDGKTGVWTKSSQLVNNALPGEVYSSRKIASLGIRISRWCTLHGFSLNVRDCSFGFNLINPCGLKDIRVTSLEEEKVDIDVSTVSATIQKRFKSVFYYN